MTREEEPKAISERTPVRIGLLIGIATISIGAVGLLFSGVWFAASWTSKVDTKLDEIRNQQSIIIESNRKIAEDVADLKAWRKLIEAGGSAQAQAAQKLADELKKDLEMHKALDDQRMRGIYKGP